MPAAAAELLSVVLDALAADEKRTMTRTKRELTTRKECDVKFAELVRKSAEAGEYDLPTEWPPDGAGL